MVKKSIEQRAAAVSSREAPGTARMQEGTQHRCIDIANADVVTTEPLVEPAKQPYVLANGRACVPKADQLIDEYVDVLLNGTGSPISSGRWVIDRMTPHVFPPSGANAVTEKTAGLCRPTQACISRNSAKTGRDKGTTRHNPGLGMMPLMPRAA
jgi:hypothetical protein